MTAGGDFPANDDLGFEDAGPTYPVAFGVEMTPQIQGILIGLLGVGLAVFGFVRLVNPQRVGNAELRDTIEQKEQQLITQKQQLEDIEEIRAELDRVVAQRRDIYSLLASQTDLETLLLDLNQRVQDTNAGIQAQKNRVRERINALGLDLEPEVIEAKIQAFTPSGLPAVIEEDETYGPVLNGKVEVQTTTVQITGSFSQVESIIRNLERLEPLLIVQNFDVSIDDTIEETVVDGNGRVALRPRALISVSFQMEALLPTQNPDELPTVELPPEGEEGAEGEAGEGGEGDEAAEPEG
ncbi:MAG: hypothetical protein AAF215_28895 [Cyanobacteria bacterium P01_A01_bin.123]